MVSHVVRLLCWCVVAFITATPSVAMTAAGTTGAPIATCVVRDPAVRTAAAAFARPFQHGCDDRQTELGSGDYWVVSGPLPVVASPDAALTVRTASLWQRAVTLHALYADETTYTARFDDSRPADAIQLGAIVEQQLPVRAGRPVRFAWHVEGAANLRGILIGAHLATVQASARSNLRMGAIYAGFAGFALALLIHNLAMWRALRQRFQLWYVGLLSALVAYTFTSSGAFAWVFTDWSNTGRIRLNYGLLATSAVFAVGFARTFFEPRVFAGWLGRLATAVSVVILGGGIVFMVAAPWRIALLNHIHALSYLGLVAIVMPVLWRAWHLRSDYRWIFAIAWAAPVILTAGRIAQGYGWIEWSFWLDNSTLATMALEALVSSVAITYRIRALVAERDAARVQELAARLLADSDPLTGLLNRRAFLARAVGRTGPQSLLILDLDRFKVVNDTIGHDGGDEVLRRVARILRAACPADGLAVRLGGEEFALLTPAASALPTADLLATLREARMPYDLTVTASIGTCTGPLATESDWKALYRAADRALFAAKRAGRDRARVAGAVALAA